VKVFPAGLGSSNPPIQLSVNAGGQWVDTIAVAIAILGIVVAAWRLAARYRSWVPVMLPVGALIAGFMEPIYTVVTNLWYMKPHQVSVLSTFGMNLPAWVLFSYCAAYGGLGLLVWWMVERGLTPRQLWATTLGFWVGFILLEICNLALGTYTYYGLQPFRIGRFPAWVSLSNAAICVSLGVLAALGGRAVPAGRQWLLVMAAPAVVAAGLFGTTFPEDIALHIAHPSRLLAYGSAIATTLLALGMTGLALALLPTGGLTPNPKDTPWGRGRPGRRTSPAASPSPESVKPSVSQSAVP